MINSLHLKIGLTLISLFALPTLFAIDAPQTSKGDGYAEYSTPAIAPQQTHPPTFGVVMLGGHGEVEEANKFLCDHSGGGKIVVLSASGEAEYNDDFHTACPANSVTTLVITSRNGGMNAFVAAQLHSASAIFISGGDQSNYVKFWSGTTVQTEINQAIARGVPIGGISAGLAVEGQFVFSSMLDTITTPEALANPYDPHLTLERDFLAIPLLRGVITDSHFSARQRMGRSMAFMSRIVQDNWASQVRDIGIDETTAILLEADGNARVTGKNAAYFFTLDHKPEQCVAGKPLTVLHISAFKVQSGANATVDLKAWSSPVGEALDVSVLDGILSVAKR
jgi:cyanophycinase